MYFGADVEDFAEMSGYNASGDMILCETDDCNGLLSGDVATVEDAFAEYKAEYDNETSPERQNVNSVMDAICAKFEDRGKCLSTLRKSSGSSRRAKRNTEMAVMVFTITYPPGFGFSNADVQNAYLSHVAALPPTIAAIATSLGVGDPANLMVTVQVGGTVGGTTQGSPAVKPSVDTFPVILSTVFALFSITASRWI